jgi:hypothetical protein
MVKSAGQGVLARRDVAAMTINSSNNSSHHTLRAMKMSNISNLTHFPHNADVFRFG